MSNHNYTQYSNPKKSTVVESVVDVAPEFVENEAVDTVIEATEVIETAAVPDPVETVEGVIANCAKLNVRAKPDAAADILCVLDVASEIEIDLANSNDEWYCVCTATGIEGYCMRKFVNARL